jgi:RNA polymerase sigma-70 factor (ECF subfamily)
MMSDGTPRLRLVAAGGEPDWSSDDALMMRASSGDAGAFSELVGRHEVALRRFCRSIVREEAASRDAAQETLLKLWASRARYRPEGRFKAYLFTLARNVARSSLRKRKVRAWIGLGPDPEASLTEALIRAQSIDLVSAALDRLAEKFRTPLVLRFIEGLEYEDIAEVIGRTPSAARSRVHYGIKELRRLLPDEVLR